MKYHIKSPHEIYHLHFFNCHAGKLVAPWFLISCWIWIPIAPSHFLRTSGSYQSTPQKIEKNGSKMVGRWCFSYWFLRCQTFQHLPLTLGVSKQYIYIPVRYSHNIKIIYRINITSTNPIISHFIILYHIKLYGYYPIIIPYIYMYIYKYN